MLLKVDWDEYIEDGGLPELHLIVCGIRDRDLETYIRAHPEELEKTDVMGYSPLWYASIFRDFADIRTLLKCGAILNGNTFNLSCFLGRFGSKAFDFMNEHLSPAVWKSLFKHGCAHHWFLDVPPQRLDVDEILAVDKLCFDHGFDINDKNYAKRDTLLMAILHLTYWYLPLRVKQLLDYGADLELTNIYGETALHCYLGSHENYTSDTKIFKMLIEYGARLDYRTKDGTTILHALILHVVYLEPVEIILHSETSGLLLDAKDIDGHTAFDLLILRARLLRLDFGDCSVSLEASHHVDYMVEHKEYTVVRFLGKSMQIANDPDRERKILTTFEALLHHIQEVQGIPPEEQYPSIESVLDQEDIDAEASRLDGLPGSWPE